MSKPTNRRVATPAARPARFASLPRLGDLVDTQGASEIDRLFDDLFSHEQDILS